MYIGSLLVVTNSGWASWETAGVWCHCVQHLRKWLTAAAWRSNMGNHRWGVSRLITRWTKKCKLIAVSLIVLELYFLLLKTALHAEMENFKSRKMFILVSTVMTWARTKPQNLVSLQEMLSTAESFCEWNTTNVIDIFSFQDKIDILLTEEEFRRRRPHPNFKKHNNLEKLVLKLGRGVCTLLTTYSKNIPTVAGF